MDPQEKKKHAAYIVQDWLRGPAATGGLDAAQRARLDSAVDALADVFGVSVDNADDQREYSPHPASLTTILDVYLKTKKRTSAKKKDETKAGAKAASEEDKAAADALKKEGNAKLSEKKFADAIDLYTKAIALNGNDPIFYANRAAAHSQNGAHADAVEDCKRALEVDPKYSKAYSRMGFSHYNLGEFAQAAAAYERAHELDPDNASVKTALDQARAKASKKSRSAKRADNGDDDDAAAKGDAAAEVAGGSAPSPAGFDPAALGSMLGNNPALASMAEQMGGAGGLQGLMNNPQIMRMAQQMMSDPAAMQNLMGMFGGGGAK